MLGRVFRLIEMSSFCALSVSQETCVGCLCPFIVRLSDDELGVRCPRCGASAITQCLVAVLRDRFSHIRELDVYEMSSSGPLLRFLRKNARSVTVSEFFDDVLPGRHRGPIQCQNVEALTFPNHSFDLCTSTEVFEHVKNDMAGFAEILRVLKPGGAIVFTVPLSDAFETVERVTYVGDGVVHIMPPEFHGDRIRGNHVLCLRNYGRDITERLASVGFEGAELVASHLTLFGHTRRVVYARRPQSK